jgi:DNA-binding LacI/PurR family transcriptional regulator
MKSAGIPITPSHIVEVEMTRAGGRQAFRQIIQTDPNADAFVCAGDLAAHGVLLEALEQDFNIPGEIAVSGFANEEFTQHITPAMTSVDQKGVHIGREAARLFLEQEVTKSGTRVVIEPEVLFRQSTMKLQHNNTIKISTHGNKL